MELLGHVVIPFDFWGTVKDLSIVAAYLHGSADNMWQFQCPHIFSTKIFNIFVIIIVVVWSNNLLWLWFAVFERPMTWTTFALFLGRLNFRETSIPALCPCFSRDKALKESHSNLILMIFFVSYSGSVFRISYSGIHSPGPQLHHCMRQEIESYMAVWHVTVHVFVMTSFGEETVLSL